MDAEGFVTNLRLAAEHHVATSLLRTIEQPPGRQPESRILELSAWFVDQGARERQMLAKSLALAAEQATYNVLLVLDGLLAIEPQGDKGKLELFYVDTAGHRTQLNDPSGVALSALF